MIFDLFFLSGAAGGGNSGGLVPALGAVAASSLNGGSCDVGGSGALLTEAQVRVQWSITNPSDADYAVKLYENGVLLATNASSFTNFDKTVSGSVEHGVAGESRTGEWTSNWTYRADLVRLSDGVVVQSQTSSPWTQIYGLCGGRGL